MHRTLLLLLLLVFPGGLTLAAEKSALPDGLYAEFTTPRGVIVAELFYRQAPLCCTSFVGLAEGTLAPRDGRPFYSGLKWYRVVPHFVLQSGDPTFAPDKPDSAVDPGHPYNFPDEIVPGLHHDAAGVLSMANSGPDTNSSEFFLTLRETNRLNYLHSVFGRVVRGLEVLPRISQDDAVAIKILRIGPAAAAFRADQAAFQARAGAAKKYSGALEPGPTAHFADPDKLLAENPPRAKNFNFKLANFERFTGRKIVARLFAKPPAATEDAVPGAYMHALATKLGVARDGILVACFADQTDWRVWIGDDLTAVFLGHPASAVDLAPEGALHRVKEALLDAAQKEGDAAFADQQKAAPAGQPVPAAQRIKLETDALLDALILKLEPTPKS